MNEENLNFSRTLQAQAKIEDELKAVNFPTDTNKLIGRVCYFAGEDEQFYSTITSVGILTVKGVTILQIGIAKRFYRFPALCIQICSTQDGWVLHVDNEHKNEWIKGDFMLMEIDQ